MLNHAHRDIDRRGDAALLARLDLRAEKVELQAGVHHADLRGIVAHPVMALAEERDPVDAGLDERLRERIGVELRADIGDMRRRMKIEMYLAVAGRDQFGG